MSLEEFSQKINEWGVSAVPFLFIVDFEMKKPIALRLDEIDPAEILFDINGVSNTAETDTIKLSGVSQEVIRKKPIPALEYEKKFQIVLNHLTYGDSFLTNLTIDTEVQLNHTLREIFSLSHARYKLFYKDEFLVFSPEIFVQIREGKIFSYPMKGTIDASVPNAEEKILNDKKELAEHITIVDLIRNDLSQVSHHVSVKKFRYLDTLKTNEKDLIQVSSEIEGDLTSDYVSRLGDVLIKLLPAGSVSGAPKPKTMEVIRQAEGSDRGYYTGVVGLFDGKKLDSGVMIRFIERRDDKFFYRSGGGVTTQSFPLSEYHEAIDKVYVPVS